jgi:alanine-glyoxylate transaminase/serine-glyoxylate transaminase/serine-pyruvate transaminase
VIEADEKALVLNTGYFGDSFVLFLLPQLPSFPTAYLPALHTSLTTTKIYSFADCLETYGASVTQLGAPVGGRPSLEAIEEALKKDQYKLITITHVDTCTPTPSPVSTAEH